MTDLSIQTKSFIMAHSAHYFVTVQLRLRKKQRQLRLVL